MNKYTVFHKVIFNKAINPQTKQRSSLERTNVEKWKSQLSQNSKLKDWMTLGSQLTSHVCIQVEEMKQKNFKRKKKVFDIEETMDCDRDDDDCTSSRKIIWKEVFSSLCYLILDLKKDFSTQNEVEKTKFWGSIEEITWLKITGPWNQIRNNLFKTKLLKNWCTVKLVHSKSKSTWS